jgi:AcrR family transcriptional regulator
MAEGRRERADAARNRQAILRATEELLARHRPEHISLEQVATTAGVGKGTVFHRFGNRTGLMHALMAERALALQENATEGPPPLGPGAPARQRLLAFLDAVIDVVTRNVGLLAALDHALSTQRQTDGPQHDADTVYHFWHAHISALIAEDRPDLDAEVLAHILLSPLHSNLIQRLLQDGESARLAANLRVLATTLLATPPEDVPSGTWISTRQ